VVYCHRVSAGRGNVWAGGELDECVRVGAELEVEDPAGGIGDGGREGAGSYVVGWSVEVVNEGTDS